MLAALALPLLALALAVSALAAIGCGSDEPREIKRADISQLPTPSGGEIFAAEGDVAPTPTPASDGGAGSEALPSESGFGAGGGGAGAFGGGAGFGDFQRMVQENPEIASLIEKAQAGTATEADAARLEQLLTEMFQPGGEFANTFAQPAIAYGTISSVVGNTVSLVPESIASAPADVDAVAMTADVVTATVGDNTSMLHAQAATLADVVDGANVDIIAARNAQGVIMARTVSVLQVAGAGAGASGQGPFGGGLAGNFGASAFLTGDGEEIPIQGRVTNVIEGRIHVEAGQGPLRVTVGDDTRYYRMGPLALADVPPDATALLMTVGEGDAVLLFVGPAELLRPVAERGFDGAGRPGLQGPGGFGEQRNGDEELEGQDGQQQQPGPGGGRRPGGARRFLR